MLPTFLKFIFALFLSFIISSILIIYPFEWIMNFFNLNLKLIALLSLIITYFYLMKYFCKTWKCVNGSNHNNKTNLKNNYKEKKDESYLNQNYINKNEVNKHKVNFIKALDNKDIQIIKDEWNNSNNVSDIEIFEVNFINPTARDKYGIEQNLEIIANSMYNKQISNNYVEVLNYADKIFKYIENNRAFVKTENNKHPSVYFPKSIKIPFFLFLLETLYKNKLSLIRKNIDSKFYRKHSANRVIIYKEVHLIKNNNPNIFINLSFFYEVKTSISRERTYYREERTVVHNQEDGAEPFSYHYGKVPYKDYDVKSLTIYKVRVDIIYENIQYSEIVHFYGIDNSEIQHLKDYLSSTNNRLSKAINKVLGSFNSN